MQRNYGSAYAYLQYDIIARDKMHQFLFQDRLNGKSNRCRIVGQKSATSRKGEGGGVLRSFRKQGGERFSDRAGGTRS